MLRLFIVRKLSHACEEVYNINKDIPKKKK